jgi:hypothetical protein
MCLLISVCGERDVADQVPQGICSELTILRCCHGALACFHNKGRDALIAINRETSSGDVNVAALGSSKKDEVESAKDLQLDLRASPQLSTVTS